MRAESNKFDGFGIRLAEEYYEVYGKDMIEKKFPKYADKIAVGLVGEGSECIGFDDEVSRDHDYGPRFCMWLDDELFDKIGLELQKGYDELPKTFKDITRTSSPQNSSHRDVMRISDFYDYILGTYEVPFSKGRWLYLDDYKLLAASSGKVFRDDLGEFSKVRDEISKYYPSDVWLKKLAFESSQISQLGQYNYERTLKRDDRLTAGIILSDFSSHVMKLIYLLNKEYAPYYKWMRRGLSKLDKLSDIESDLDEIARLSVGDDNIPTIIERIAKKIIDELKNQKLIDTDELFLDYHREEILKRITGVAR